MAVGWMGIRLTWSGFGGRLLFLVRELAHDFRLRDHHTVDGRDAGHFGDAGLALDDLHLHAQRIAGHYRTAEARVFYGDEQNQLAVAVLHAFEHQNAGSLRHGFDDQDTRHHGKIREMTLEEGLVVGHILDPDNSFGLHFHDAVDQEKGGAVGENGADLVDVQNGHGTGYYSSGGSNTLLSPSPTDGDRGADPAVRRMRISERYAGGGEPVRGAGLRYGCGLCQGENDQRRQVR